METGGRFINETRDIGGTRRGLQALRRANGKTAFINEEPDAECLRDNECDNDQKDELAAQAVREIPFTADPSHLSQDSSRRFGPW